MVSFRAAPICEELYLRKDEETFIVDPYLSEGQSGSDTISRMVPEENFPCRFMFLPPTLLKDTMEIGFFDKLG